MRRVGSIWLIVLLAGCSHARLEDAAHEARADERPYVMVLGIAQDGGLPQAGCRSERCEAARRDPAKRRLVSSLAVVDPLTSQRWLFDATPDLREQLDRLDAAAGSRRPVVDGVFLTHAHMGHYTGLMHFGREALGASGIPVYAMPRMARFLETNGPWDQLVKLNNIELRPLRDGVPVRLNERISVTPLLVPHRDEYSETVGYRIEGPRRSVLFIPDIDKWERWDERIEDRLAEVDVAYLDATFFADGELPNRDISSIPHPFIAETMARLASLPLAERAKVRFIHLNHTNPALDEGSAARQAIERAGMRVAEEGERIPLH